MGTGKSLRFLGGVLALINLGFGKINLTVVCWTDEGKNLKTASC